MTESTYRFSQRADNYIKYRPRYPAAVLELLKAECQLTETHIIADIGSGMGILSELFLKNGNPVFGVEPDPAMRAGGGFYLKDYPGFTSVAATAEVTTLPDHAVDFVTAGQAFHWFDPEQARREFGRILSNGPALEPGDPFYETMLAALKEIFQAHQVHGTVIIDHDTWVVYGQLPVKI
ncbi:MAG: class I SAM-dependent methyltransferase [Chloroflexota bacterium]|nr:MAG: class I SAM-dependent methyltransferase [Chloroflexota bacterium]